MKKSRNFMKIYEKRMKSADEAELRGRLVRGGVREDAVLLHEELPRVRHQAPGVPPRVGRLLFKFENLSGQIQGIEGTARA